jgi:hypothetical protein
MIAVPSGGIPEAESGYETIKALAKEQGLRITDLIVLARDNDPYFCGSPAHSLKGEWFMRQWRNMGYTGQQGIHLRRMHYRLVSQSEPVLMPDGMPYTNTTLCWGFLGGASKPARYLGFVAPDDFVDKRNPDPHLFAAPVLGPRQDPQWEIDLDSRWALPAIPVHLSLGIDFPIPQPAAVGYEYDPSDQPCHLEIWIEKSTMNDVLEPLCQELGINLVTSAGFQSITNAVNMLARVDRFRQMGAEKIIRVLYISDFDPAGDDMPVAVARQFEFWRSRYAPGADVKLTPLALTREQVIQYRLPRTPIKDEDKRKGKFEDRYGEGATELDALEALHPGELARLVHKAAHPYRDRRLARRLDEAADEADEALRAAWEEAIGEYREELEGLEKAAREITARYQDRLAALNDELQADLEPTRKQVEAAWHAMEEAASSLEVSLPPRPEPNIDLPDESGWLFDSGRDYLDQLSVYKRRKHGEGDDHA